MVLTKGKAPTEILHLPFNFIGQLGEGEELSSADGLSELWSGTDLSPSTVVYGTPEIVGTTAYLTVQGGEPGNIYRLKVTALTTYSQVFVMYAYLAIEDDPMSGLMPGTVLENPETGFAFLAEKAATLLLPQSGDHITLLYVNTRVRITQVTAVLVGGTSPAVSFNLWYGASRASGTQVQASDFTVTSLTSGNAFTTITNPNIPADNWFWATITSVTGDPTEFSFTIEF